MSRNINIFNNLPINKKNTPIDQFSFPYLVNVQSFLTKEKKRMQGMQAYPMAYKLCIPFLSLWGGLPYEEDGGVCQNCEKQIGATKILFCGRGLHVFPHM